MILEILLAGVVADAIHQEVKKTGKVPPAMQNTMGKVAGKTGTELGKALANAISKSLR